MTELQQDREGISPHARNMSNENLKNFCHVGSVPGTDPEEPRE